MKNLMDVNFGLWVGYNATTLKEIAIKILWKDG